jgi:peptidoglycan/LPS O-acetylase OafA/YrhL
VDLFFVLSGFLISGLLFAEYRRHGSLRVGRFLIRRGFKIYPPFYVFLAVTMVAYLSFSHVSGRLLRDFAVEAVYLQSYVPAIWEHTWSLAVEEHFYVLLPLLLLGLMRRRPGVPDPFRPLLVIVPVAGAVALGARIATLLLGPIAQWRNFTPTHLRLDELLWGVLLGYLYHFHRERTEAFAKAHGHRLLVLAVVLIAPSFVLLPLSPYNLTVGRSLLALGCGWLVVWGVLHAGATLSGRVGRALARVGFYSYSIYLWHLMVSRWGLLPLRRGAVLADLPATAAYLVNITLYVAGALVVGIAMAKVVETRSLALRDRLFPSRAPAVPLAG